MAELTDLSAFLRLSATLNYQLGAVGVGSANILNIILGDRHITPAEEEVVLAVLGYLGKAYGDHRRRLGPLAVLHPIRATALLVRTLPRPTLLDLLTELLHDKLEDIRPELFPASKFSADHWTLLEQEFNTLLRRIDPTDSWYLMERLDFLTRRQEVETYYAYIGRLLERSHTTSELVRVKLADRLDNTLDMRIDLYDPLERVDFFSLIFQILFVESFTPPAPQRSHPIGTPINGAQRLYQLFKNAVLLSLVRKKHTVQDDAADALFAALAEASIKEAQRNIYHLLVYHLREVKQQRKLVLEAMRYCQAGGTSRITRSGGSHRLDGLILDRFDHSSSADRDRALAELYRDKPLMAQAALAFIVVFQSFLNDPHYHLKGISDRGIRVED